MKKKQTTPSFYWPRILLSSLPHHTSRSPPHLRYLALAAFALQHPRVEKNHHHHCQNPSTAGSKKKPINSIRRGEPLPRYTFMPDRARTRQAHRLRAHQALTAPVTRWVNQINPGPSFSVHLLSDICSQLTSGFPACIDTLSMRSARIQDLASMTTKFLHRFQRFTHRFRFVNSFYRPSNTGLSAGMETPHNNEGLFFFLT